MNHITRREFTGSMASAVLAYGLLDMLWTQDLFAESVKPIIGQWFKELYAVGEDLHGQKLKDTEFQAKMEDLFRKVDLAELLRFMTVGIKQRRSSANGASSASFDLGRSKACPRTSTSAGKSSA